MIISVMLDLQWWLQKHLFCRTTIEQKYIYGGCKLERHSLNEWKRQEAPRDALPRDTASPREVSMSSGLNRLG